jgi:tRNA (guanine26-N2/guanine27-N2)-dimethyltransferase
MRKITEGRAAISVPRQPLTRKAEAFYNPEMGYQRDLTVSALRVFSGEKKGARLSVCEPLAGTGVRCIRIAKEVPGIGSLLMNDASPRAFEVMWKNVEENGIADSVGIRLENTDARRLFIKVDGKFDYIDIDPFGSPVYFLPYAALALKHGSMLGCTATDTGALCGTFPSTCLQRYGIRAVKTDFFKETGVRVLITSVMMELARHGLAFVPLYAHANHYFRILGRVVRKKSTLTSHFRSIAFACWCPSCLYRSTRVSVQCPACGKKTAVMGPLWLGNITDKAFCRKMLKDLESRGYGRMKELETAISEVEEPFYYDLHRLFRTRKSRPIKLSYLIEKLQSAGFRSSRTHLCDTGIRTSSPLEELLSLL